MKTFFINLKVSILFYILRFAGKRLFPACIMYSESGVLSLHMAKTYAEIDHSVMELATAKIEAKMKRQAEIQRLHDAVMEQMEALEKKYAAEASAAEPPKPEKRKRAKKVEPIPEPPAPAVEKVAKRKIGKQAA